MSVADLRHTVCTKTRLFHMRFGCWMFPPLFCLIRYTLDEFGTARRCAVVRGFIDALTRGGQGGTPRPIEMHSHDPMRYNSNLIHELSIWTKNTRQFWWKCKYFLMELELEKCYNSALILKTLHMFMHFTKWRASWLWLWLTYLESRYFTFKGAFHPQYEITYLSSYQQWS